MRKVVSLVVLLLACGMAYANTPGQHSVQLSWNASPTAGVTGYNIYRGSAAGVCSGNPTPYVKGVIGTQYLDTIGLSDGQTLFYNVSAVGTGGVESACDGEIQVQIPVLPAPPSGLSGVVQ